MAATGEVVVASSPVDAGISCWDLDTGAELLRYRSCASPPHGLTCVGRRFLASSQLPNSSSPSCGCVLYWSWNKAQPEVKSLPEVVNPLAANSDGTFIVGGSSTGHLYLWEVASGRLIKKWHAHFQAVTCLQFFDDESLLISGAEDGGIKVYSLCKVFDLSTIAQSSELHEFYFAKHTLRVTSITSGYGGCNAIVISSSLDRTCKIWSLTRGTLLRTIDFPAIIDAVALDPGEHVFYAGCRDSKIYIAALNAVSLSGGSHASHILGSLSDHSKAVTCLAYSRDGISLLSGSEDGTIRVWNTKNRHVFRVFKHAKGPINNIIIVRQPIHTKQNTSDNLHVAGSRKQLSGSLPPPLARYIDSADENGESRPIKVLLNPVQESFRSEFLISRLMTAQVKELQNQSSSTAIEMELQRVKADSKRSLQMLNEWEKRYQDLLKFSLNELLSNSQAGDSKGNVKE